MNIFIIFILLFFLTIIKGFTLEQKQNLMKDIKRLQRAEPVDFVGAVVRLAFHESGTFSPPNTSGPDGCIMHKSGANFGLEHVVKQLKKLRLEHYITISQSDFWIFAACHALDLAAIPTGQYHHLRLVDRFRWGRIDRPSCKTDEGKLVGPHSNVKGVFDVFQKRLGFSAKEITALMGGHSVGRAEAKNVGFEGKFDPTPSIFDNKYFQQMIKKKWKRTQSGNNVFWKNKKSNVMLFHTDMLLAYKVGDAVKTDETCHVRIGSNQCSKDANHHGTRFWVEHFARNLPSFYRTFAKAWTRMMDFGTKNLQPIH